MTQFLTPDEFALKLYDFRTPGKLAYVGLVPSVVAFLTTGDYFADMLSHMNDVSEIYNGKIQFYAVDVNQYPILGKEFGIRVIPTTIFSPVSSAAAVVSGLIGKKSELEELTLRFVPLISMPNQPTSGLILPGK